MFDTTTETNNLEDILIDEESLSLDEIENILNSGLLQDNYQGLTKESGKECERLVIDYINLTESVKGKHVFFVKKLTKVAFHITQNTTNLKGQLERIYEFNIEGAKMAHELREDPQRLEELQIPTIRARNLESHFLAYAGRAKVQLYKSTKKSEQALTGHEHLIHSALMVRLSDPMFAVGMFIEAAELAKEVAKKEKNPKLAIYFGEKRYNAYNLASELVEASNAQSFFKIHANTADAAEWLFKRTNDFKWGYRWFKTYFDSAQKAETHNSPWTSYHYAIAAKAAKKLMLIDKRVFWEKQHKYCVEKQLEYHHQNQRIPKDSYDRIKHRRT